MVFPSLFLILISVIFTKEVPHLIVPNFTDDLPRARLFEGPGDDAPMGRLSPHSVFFPTGGQVRKELLRGVQ